MRVAIGPEKSPKKSLDEGHGFSRALLRTLVLGIKEHSRLHLIKKSRRTLPRMLRPNYCHG
jgi:hypothetical protein